MDAPHLPPPAFDSMRMRKAASSARFLAHGRRAWKAAVRPERPR